MGRRTIAGSRALVTGASSGIGRAISLELARDGADLIITARRSEALASLGSEIAAMGRKWRSVTGDITDPDVREQCLAEAAALGGLDILVNNAGIGAIGPFIEADEARLRRLMDVNFFAAVEMIRGAVPLLRRATRPIVVNVGSVLGHRAVPWKSEYCASKFAMHGFTDSLRAEFADQGIDVLLVSPSTTRSEFFDKVLGEPSTAQHSAMSPESVARRTVRAIRLGRHEIILSWGGRALVWADRICPPLINRLVARFGTRAR